MKSFALAVLLAFVAMGLTAPDAYAKRFGGGGSFGMQRSMPPRATPQTPPPSKAAPATPATPGTAAAAAPKRSWMGPIAGLAAGLGLAALFSHLGLGEGLANVMMLALLAFAAIFAVRFLMRRFAPQPPVGALRYAGAEAGGGMGQPNATLPAGPFAPRDAASPFVPAANAAALAPSLPDGFDAAAFERIAKLIFIRLQAANDAGDLDDLRAFTTPEVFASSRLELQERGTVGQRTDVVQVDAEVLEVANEADRQVVSVRFHGLIREQDGGVAEPFDEVWHLTKPADGSREWAIAGIQQVDALSRAA